MKFMNVVLFMIEIVFFKKTMILVTTHDQLKMSYENAKQSIE